ncbi:hypothetical protein LZ32DRAFT_603718 [Colletotrichum eremochloae]|nr:hypothetical protein LZ32DRAFT_603718 [Colletotrichum eremochloae]
MHHHISTHLGAFLWPAVASAAIHLLVIHRSPDGFCCLLACFCCPSTAFPCVRYGIVGPGQRHPLNQGFGRLEPSPVSAICFHLYLI